MLNQLSTLELSNLPHSAHAQIVIYEINYCIEMRAYVLEECLPFIHLL